MKAYYGSRFSPNMTETPEGFLVCHNVPIARVGWYEYLGEEIGVDDKRGEVVNVYRSPEEVFDPGAIASFEGKVLTDEHPPDLVTPDNASRYAKGHVQNVRQGSKADSDLLVADLVVTDQQLIDEIQDGKREVSAGYECTYEDAGNDKYLQKQICGNHVAVVKSGRAGDRVAIKDSKPTKGAKKMKKMSKSILQAMGFKQLMADAEPEEIMDALTAMTKGEDDAPPAPPQAPQQQQDPAMQLLTEMKALLQQLVQGKAADADPKPEDAIDAAIEELQKAGDDAGEEEESRTIPAASMDDEGPVSSPEDRPTNPITGDNAYKIAALKAMKPIIAAIPDPKQRKIATDAMLASIKGKPPVNTYGKIKPQKPAQDSKPTADARAQQIADLGRKIAEQYNPHYKKQA
jgi:hypothetical protein